MDETQRTKLLGGILLAVLGFMAIRPDQKLFQPIKDAQRQLGNAEEDLEREEMKRMELLVARENIGRGRATSLPYSISDAQRLYQTWITNLAEQCNFSRLTVSPGNAAPVRGQFITVDVNVEAETDLEGLSRFLYLHDKADLMHRIVDLEVESSGSQSNPRMEITLKAQGMSVFGSPDRADVFPRTSITGDIDRDSTELTVAEDKGFPTKTPFLAQLNGELIRVTKAEGGKWTIERGLEATSAESHAKETMLQLFPVAPLKDASFKEYDELIAGSPFTKPKPARVYRPRIASVMNKTIEPGESVAMTARAEDVNKDIGAPMFELKDAAEGMAINKETGELTWETTAETEPADYSGTVVLTQTNNNELSVEKQFTITVKLPNEAPTLELPDEAVVILGREFSLTATAEDSDGDELKYSFESEAPEGLAIDESSGKISWTPANTLKPGEYEITVKVTDKGELSASDSMSLKVEDDHASLTKFTGSVALDGVPSAYFRNLGTNARPILKVGDRVVVSEINAELKEIANRHVLLADADGVWKLALGGSLRERELIEPAEKEDEASAEDGDQGEAGAADDAPDSGSDVAEESVSESDQETEEPATSDSEAEATEEPARQKPSLQRSSRARLRR